ncbi:hypothetical protein [Boseongicola sp. H5]|uniref:hypothetical protein n=1 Tax=Boseongicola sp. H5 TaxID=2763261 RepID=UPI001D0A6B4D|nr:hypothetical protein [Boseongicola sp. H5]
MTSADRQNEVLLALYACVVDPDRFVDFFVLLEQALSEAPLAATLLEIEQHSERVYQHLLSQDRQSSADDLTWVQSESAEALQIALEDRGYDVVADDLRRMKALPDDEKMLLRFASLGGQTEWGVVEHRAGTWAIYRRTNSWEAFLRQQFHAQFDLTEAELDVLIRFAGGRSLRQIATDRGSTYNTVRNQIRSVIEKLGCATQSDLMATTSQLSSIGTTIAPAAADSSSAEDMQILRLPDGRALELKTHNMAAENKLLYFHCLASGKHWSDEAMEIARKQGFGVISSSRAGFGRSTLVRKTGPELLQSHVSDYRHVLDALAPGQTVVSLAFGTGFAPAFSFALRYPDRCRVLIAINPIPPLDGFYSASGLRGLFKAAFLAARFTPAAFRALAKMAVRKHRANLNDLTAPTVLPDVNLRELESTSGYVAFRRNAEENTFNNGECFWREGTISTSDWGVNLDGLNSIPKVLWLETEDSPFTVPGAFETYRRKIKAKRLVLPKTFPFLKTQLPEALAAIRDW